MKLRFALPLLLLPLAGCDQLGALGGVIAYATPKTVRAAYPGLAGQSVVVMVWADRGVRQDNPLLQEQVAAAVQDKLINLQLTEKPEDLAGASFPYSTPTVIKQQENHPEWETMSVEQVASKLNATRLVYIEITDYATRSAASLELFRGSMTARVRVVEMTADATDHVTTKLAYDGGDISVLFPKDVPKDGLPNRTDDWTNEGTINAFKDKLAERFYKHDEDRN